MKWKVTIPITRTEKEIFIITADTSDLAMKEIMRIKCLTERPNAIMQVIEE